MRHLLIVLFGVLLAVAPVRAQTPAADAPVIAAASDLKFALDEVIARFKAETGRDVKPAYGSSGNFARQIEQGAPFQMLLSADEALVFRLADAKLTLDRGSLYAIGRIVLFAPVGSSLDPSKGLAGLRTATDDGAITRFAIANPEHAPYGRAAKEALERARLWAPLQSKLVLGENVAQAAQFASSGSTQGGIFAYSLALAPEVARRGRFALIPASAHKPLVQRMVLTKSAGPSARAFYAYMQRKAARAILVRYGFTLPGDKRQ